LPHLPINTDDGTRLRNHPYVGYKSANLILAYRKEHGPFINLDDCRKMLAITPETWDKLAPYLEF
jgi:competence protein ComEA